MYEREWRRISRREEAVANWVVPTIMSRGKPYRFGALCAKLTTGELLICEEACDKDFLEIFLDQARNQRFNASGRSLIRFDDCADAVSYACDPALSHLSPQVSEEQEWSPFRKPETEDEMMGSRYVRWAV
jgi:hypothetical protein